MRYIRFGRYDINNAYVSDERMVPEGLFHEFSPSDEICLKALIIPILADSPNAPPLLTNGSGKAVDS